MKSVIKQFKLNNMENNKSSFEKFIESLFTLVKLALVFLLIWMYIDEWKESWQNKKWIKFILLSIIPALMMYVLLWDILVGKGSPPGFDNPYVEYDNY
jgi:small-conductance mechanosensitive channel